MNPRLEYLTKRTAVIIIDLYKITDEHESGHIKLTVSNLISRIRDYKSMCDGTSGNVHQGTLDLLETQITLAEDFIIRYYQEKRSNKDVQEKPPILESKGISLDSGNGNEIHEIFGGF